MFCVVELISLLLIYPCLRLGCYALCTATSKDEERTWHRIFEAGFREIADGFSFITLAGDSVYYAKYISIYYKNLSNAHTGLF